MISHYLKKRATTKRKRERRKLRKELYPERYPTVTWITKKKGAR